MAFSGKNVRTALKGMFRDRNLTPSPNGGVTMALAAAGLGVRLEKRGVYVLNTKTHPGGRVWVGRHQVRVNGQPTPYLRNSRFEAERASRLLSDAVGAPVPVRPVLVFLTGTLVPDVTIEQAPDDVLVLDRTDVPGAFRRAPQRLAPQQAEAIFEQARRSTTWQRPHARR